MSPEHNHDHHSHGLDLARVNQKAFVIGIGLNVLFVITEVVAGLLYQSMALLTDAGHNAGDVASLLLSMFAFRLAKRKPSEVFTYGLKKTTVLAALANAVILLVAVGVLGFKSVTRLRHPEPVQGSAIAWVAGAGILINSLSAYLFYRNREQDLNVKSAYLHLVADALVSAGVVVAGIVIAFTGWYWVDPLIGLVVMLVILVSTWSLLRDSFRMAVDAVPANISVSQIISVIRSVPYVKDVCHVHIWSLSTTENALTAHLIVAESLSFEEKVAVVHKVKHELEHLNVNHSTIELQIKKCADSFD